MSTETANAARFKKGMTALTPLEGELLEACEPFANYACRDWLTHDCHNCITLRAVHHAHGETP